MNKRFPSKLKLDLLNKQQNLYLKRNKQNDIRITPICNELKILDKCNTLKKKTAIVSTNFDKLKTNKNYIKNLEQLPRPFTEDNVLNPIQTPIDDSNKPNTAMSFTKKRLSDIKNYINQNMEPTNDTPETNLYPQQEPNEQLSANSNNYIQNKQKQIQSCQKMLQPQQNNLQNQKLNIRISQQKVIKVQKQKDSKFVNNIKQINIESEKIQQMKDRFFDKDIINNDLSQISHIIHESFEIQTSHNISIGSNNINGILKISSSSQDKKDDCTIQTVDSQNFGEDQAKPEGKIKKWYKGQMIGTGKYGQVFKALDFYNNQVFVVKQIFLFNDINGDIEENFTNEIQFLQRLKNIHIIEYITHEKLDQSIYIYMEYMSKGSISQILENEGKFKEEQIKKISIQILQGLTFLHQNNIIHKDLKGSNILMNQQGIVKLSDFGSAKQIEKTLSLCLNDTFQDAIKGSIPWMAPEVIKQSKYGRKADIWSFGCTLIEMVNGKVPWSEYNFDNPVEAILKIGISNDLPQFPSDLSENLTSFINTCLQRDYYKRPYAKELLNHPFLIN